MATKKTATKKAAATKKGAEAKGQGRTSATAGKKITKVVKVEDTGLRATGQVRECWDLIKDGMTVETYRSKATNSGLALKCLREFAAKGFVKLT